MKDCVKNCFKRALPGLGWTMLLIIVIVAVTILFAVPLDVGFMVLLIPLHKVLAGVAIVVGAALVSLAKCIWGCRNA